MDSVLAEVWAWYVFGMIILLTRYAVRLRTVGLRGFQGDDYLTIATIAFYTLDAAIVNIVHVHGVNANVTEELIPALTKSDIARLTYGSKMEFTALYSYTSLIFSLKFSMLFFYKRLTFGSMHERMVKHLSWVCGIAYLAVLLTITFSCYPVHLNWQVVPIPPWKCTFRPQTSIVAAVLNIVTDAALMMVPIPLLAKLKIPLRNKLVIGLLLSSGLFVITAAIIRVVFSVNPQPSASNINRWGVRETIIAIVTINVPILRPLFTRAFWAWGPFDPTSSVASRSATRGDRSGYTGSAGAEIELGGTTAGKSAGLGGRSRSSSQENIMNWDRKDDVVFVQTTYDIQSHDRSDDGSIREEQSPSWNVMKLPR